MGVKRFLANSKLTADWVVRRLYWVTTALLWAVQISCYYPWFPLVVAEMKMLRESFCRQAQLII